MYISQQLKKQNIAEYLLYMWQIEDLIRANRFDMESIRTLSMHILRLRRNRSRHWTSGTRT